MIYHDDEEDDEDDVDQVSGDKLWSMPLEYEYDSAIKSSIANLKNSGGRGGGSINAALFLSEFVEHTPNWAHIDMAGPVWDSTAQQATGFGAKLLIEYVMAMDRACCASAAVAADSDAAQKK